MKMTFTITNRSDPKPVKLITEFSETTINPQVRVVPDLATALPSRRADARPRQRILVADDDEDIRLLIGDALAECGFEVVAARDGEEAWSLALRNSFDLVITDNDMPRLTGLELINRMREALAGRARFGRVRHDQARSLRRTSDYRCRPEAV
jgi:hypothetical protein